MGGESALDAEQDERFRVGYVFLELVRTAFGHEIGGIEVVGQRDCHKLDARFPCLAILI